MTNIVICDGSSVARKQIARALPQELDLDISFASDGEEAMNILRTEQVEVLILDLNMPIMDGYEVLKQILDEGLECKIVVVSGDIQPEAHSRVMELGASKLIKKPVVTEELADTFNELGILSTSHLNREVGISADALEGYKEIANIAVGQAAELLAQNLNICVEMRIPHVSKVEASELVMIFEQANKGDDVAIICQGFVGLGIAGEGILVIYQSAENDIIDLLDYKNGIDDTTRQELLLEIASIFINASMQGIAQQLDIVFSMGIPVVMGDFLHAEKLIETNASRWKNILAIEMESKIEGKNITCNLLLLFTKDSLKSLNKLVGYI